MLVRSYGADITDDHDGHVSWTAYLDPAVTVFLSAAMALSMRGVIMQSAHVLLEGTIAPEENDRLHRAICQVPGVHAVKKLVVTDLDFDGSARRAEVVILSTRTHMLSVSNLGGGVSGAGGRGGAASTDQQATGALRAEVRRALAGCGVRSAWATVEVE